MSDYVVTIAVAVVLMVFILLVRSQLLTRLAREVGSITAKTAEARTATVQELAQLTAGLPRPADLETIRNGMTEVSGQVTTISEELSSRILLLQRTVAEDREAFEKRIEGILANEVGRKAAAHVEELSVPRHEFDRLRTRVDRLMGAEELIERLDAVRSIFESADARIMTWQCKLIRLLEGGLAPDAESDQMVAAGIPLSQVKGFLNKLSELGVITAKKVTSYWITEEYEWLLVAAEDPEGIRTKIATFTKNEKEYQAYVVAHLQEVEEGLALVGEQWEVPTGRIDIKARDRSGVDTYIELKHPAATSSAYSQVLKYKQDILSQPGAGIARFILVAPRVSGRVRELLERDSCEWCEVAF